MLACLFLSVGAGEQINYLEFKQRKAGIVWIHIKTNMGKDLDYDPKFEGADPDHHSGQKDDFDDRDQYTMDPSDVVSAPLVKAASK